MTTPTPPGEPPVAAGAYSVGILREGWRSARDSFGTARQAGQRSSAAYPSASEAQRAIDGLTRTVQGLQRSLQTLEATVNRVAGGTMQGGRLGKAETLGSGLPNGGTVGIPTTAGTRPGSAYDATLLGGGGSPTPNGGGVSFRGMVAPPQPSGGYASAGSAIGSGVRFSGMGQTMAGRIGGAVGYGAALGLEALSLGARLDSVIRDPMTQMNYMGTRLGFTGNMSGYDVSRMITNNIRSGFNSADIMQGGANILNMTGATPNTMYGQQMVNLTGAMQMVNPTLGAAGNAQALGQLAQSGSYYRLRGLFGVSTLNNRGQLNPQSIQQILLSMRGGRMPTAAELQASQRAGTAGYNDFRVLAQNTSPETANMVMQYGIMQARAQQRGINPGQFQTLLTQAQAGNTGARNRLRGAGVDSTLFERQQDLQGQYARSMSDLSRDYIPAATSALDSFTKAVQAATWAMNNIPGARNAIGNAAGWGGQYHGMISGAMHLAEGSLLLKGASKLLGIGGRAAGGLLRGTLGRLPGIGRLFGGGAEAAGAGEAGTIGLGAAARAIPPVALGLSVFHDITHPRSDWNQGWRVGSGTASAKSLLSMSTFDPITAVSSIAGLGNQLGKGFGFWGGASTGPGRGASGGGSKGTGKSVGGPTGSQVVNYAEHFVGTPYQWGGASPQGFDCSGLVQYVYGHFGVNLPRVAADQQRVGKDIPPGQAQPGDLIFFGNPAHHVAIALGGGQMLDAPHTGAQVRNERIWPGVSNVKRVLNRAGGAVSITDTGNPGAGGMLNQQSNQGDIGALVGSGGAYGSSSELAAMAPFLGGEGTAGMGGFGIGFGASSPARNNQANANSAGVVSGGARVPSNPSGNARLGKQMASQRGWTGAEWDALYKLWMRESSWNANAVNPSSGAYGIPQSLGHGHPYNLGDPRAQIAWGLDYIAGRYGDPKKAWAHEESIGWYEKGAWEIVKDELAQLHKGEMVVPAETADMMRKAISQGAGAGSKMTVTVGPGAIVIYANDEMGGRKAAKGFLDYLHEREGQDTVTAS